MKILDLLGLTELVDLCKQTFANITHTHKLEDITDYTVDSSLSSTSTNPVQNKIVQAAIQTLEDSKADKDELPTKTSDITNDSGFITVTEVNTHNTSTSAHNDIRLLVSDISTKLNNFLNVDDTTKDQLSELIALIEANADDIESITSGKVNVSDIVNNLTTNVSNKPLSAAQGVAIKALIDSLQGNLETHVSNADVHFTTVERTKLSGITTGAEVNQNAFSNVKVGSTTITADTKTDTIEFVGSNVTITPDATNDKITFAVANGSTSAKGIVQLTDSTSSTSTTTAATPKSVKSAYDLANTAKTNAATAQATADGKADKGHKHTVSEVTDLTVTAAELNYMDGVTSNVQAQLNAKANASALGDQVTFTLSGTTLTITSK